MKGLPEGWRVWWERFTGGEAREGAGGFSPGRALPLLLLLGALLMLWSGPEKREEGAAPAGLLQESRPPGPQSELEARVAQLLSNVQGAGRVEVMIVPKSTEVLVLAEEVTERTSRSQGTGEESESEASLTRRPVTVKNDGEKREEPVVLYRRKPEVAGVLVVADGASDPRVRRLLLEAVATVLDVPPHRVGVVPRRG